MTRYPFAVALVAPVVAHAADLPRAEALFQDAKSLLEAKDYERACPKMAESYRLDPATGTLLALAMCHESQGKLASAWSEYVGVVAAARRDARKDREEFARQRADGLRPRLSTLTLRLAGDARRPGLRIVLDGSEVGEATVGDATPIDGGEHTVELSATGARPWKVSFRLAHEGERKEILLPRLDDEPAAPAPAPASRSVRPAEAPASAAAPRTPAYLGLGLAVVGAGLGTYFGLRAVELASQARGSCPSSGPCSDRAAVDAASDARAAGNVATAAFVAGAVAGVVGAYFLIRAGARRPAAAVGIGPATIRLRVDF
jgi:hypothetical protein